MSPSQEKELAAVWAQLFVAVYAAAPGDTTFDRIGEDADGLLKQYKRRWMPDPVETKETANAEGGG